MTGVVVSAQALATRASKLPLVEFIAPECAIGKNTGEALRSGVMLGYAGAVDALAGRISEELGGDASVVATGGLGGMFLGLCKSLQGYEPTLTLDGLVIASRRLAIITDAR
jgi:type III pantothenate kinase